MDHQIELVKIQSFAFSFDWLAQLIESRLVTIKKGAHSLKFACQPDAP
jgi:hypothetical protein